MKPRHWIPAAFAAAIVLAGCDNQFAARHGVGNARVDLPACRKFENANWKGDDAAYWYTTRPMRPGEFPETHEYRASTLFGLLEGSLTFVEHPCAKGGI